MKITDAQKERLKRNAEKWKKDVEACKKKKKACEDAIDWAKKTGNYLFFPKKLGFDDALKVGNGSLGEAFRLEKLLGILGQESSFGTRLKRKGSYRGPFQLGKQAVDTFNEHNNTKYKWPDDVMDIEIAAKIAAWYLAWLLHEFTKKKWDKLKFPQMTDADEANKFALAAYNGGIGAIQKARDRAQKAGKDPNKWDDVKEFLLHKTKKQKKKKKEIEEYVEKIREYEKLARELKCVP